MNAIISPDGVYRYRLERQCCGVGATAVIMVNPSITDATIDDPTIRKLMGFGNQRGWGRLIVGNIFALRSARVQDLDRSYDPVGPENADQLQRIIRDAGLIIVAWGTILKVLRRWRDQWRLVDQMIRITGKQPYAIGRLMNSGHPRHPLMIPYDATIRPWTAPEASE